VSVTREDDACVLRVELGASLPPGFSLETQIGRGPRDARGGDIVIGDPQFDQRLRVQSRNPAAAIRILREPEVQRAILELFARFPDAVVQGTSIELRFSVEPSVEEARAAMQLGASVCRVLGPAAEREAATHAARRDETKEEGIELPSRRFRRDPGERPRTHAARAFQRNAGVTGTGLGIALFIVTGVLREYALEGLTVSWLQVAVLGLIGAGILGAGLAAVARANTCSRCGESLIEPDRDGRSRASIFLHVGRCPNCGAWNA
jgi:hypothetical protein